MNKQEAIKPYPIVLLWLAITSAIISFFTLFVPMFKIDIGIANETQNAIDYFISMFRDKSFFSGGINTIKSILISMVVIVIPLVNFISIACDYSKRYNNLFVKRKDSFMYRMMDLIKVNFIFYIAYYIFCMFIILTEFDGDIWKALTNESLTTKTYIPMILQIIVFIIARFFYNHWSNVLAGKVVPLNFGIINVITSASNVSFKESTDNPSDSAKSEMQNIELLKKYKELFDTGIITEEEFNAKKEKLLKTGHNDSADNSNSQQTYSNFNADNSDTQQTYSNFSTTDDEMPKQGMKWYKFLIYFILFASAAGNIIQGIMLFTGALYGDYKELVYNTFPELHIVDIFFGLASIGFGILALATRSSLYWNKRKGPKQVCTLYILAAVMAVLNAVVYTLIAGQVIGDYILILIYIVFIQVVVSIFMAITNHIYFKKRKDMFKF